MMPSHQRQALPILVLAAILALSTTSTTTASECGLNTPANPVPQQRNGAVLWPEANGEVLFRPGQPGQTLPKNRDTTDRFGGLSVPNAANGHELFKSLDIAGDTLFVAYSLGIQAWNIAPGFEEKPQLLSFRDLWNPGDFLVAAPSTSEQLNFISDISAIQPSGGGDILVGVAGKMPFVGPTIWKYNRQNHFQLLYQDAGNGAQGGTSTLQVRMAEIGGRVYLFGAGGDGIYIYDATAATSLTRCLDDQGAVFACRGVFKGLIPGSRARYIDTIEVNGRLYLAMSGGRDGFKIFELEPSLSAPLSAEDATLVYSNSNFVNSPALFEYRGKHWLAYVALTSIQIFDISNCVDGNGCNSLDQEWTSWGFDFAGEQFLTYSEAANGTPFLYYGVSALNLSGPRVEQLIDLSSLDVSNNSIFEITDSGGSYIDACNNEVDYWGHYYGENEHGLREMHPRIGKFKGNFFYRAGQTILDVHVRNPSDVSTPAPRVTTTALTKGPYYFGVPIAFSATAESCSGTEAWEWLSNDANVTGLGTAGASRSLTFGYCASRDCPERTANVWAVKDACAADPELDIREASVTLRDPRARVKSLDVTPSGTIHPLCTVLSYSAGVDGRPPFNYDWKALSVGDGLEIESSSSEVFVFDTSAANLSPDIFADGFESGDVAVWSSLRSAASAELAATVGTVEPVSRGIQQDIPVDIRVAVSNADDPGGDIFIQRITLTPLGDLSLQTPGILATDNGAALYDLTMNVQNATEWRWIIEDPENGATTQCDGHFSRCTVYDWGEEGGTLSYQWTTPNPNNTGYRVRAQARNCRNDEVSAVHTVQVTDIEDPVPPGIISFKINVLDSEDCTKSSIPDCTVGTRVNFDLVFEGNPTSVRFDWDDDGQWDRTITVPGSYQETFGSTGTYFPRAQAVKGSEFSPITSMSGGNGSFTIVP